MGAGLFAACLLCVFRVLPWPWLLGLTVVLLALARPQLLLAPDFALLATFVCFFVLSGCLAAWAPLRAALGVLLAKNTVLTAAGVSQFISNVPAAVLLSGFTRDARGLLLGTDLGGLGTPAASLASLITLKAYLRAPNAKPGRFLLVFTLFNFGLLVPLLALAA